MKWAVCIVYTVHLGKSKKGLNKNYPMDVLTPLNRRVESSTISSIDFSILGSNKRFFDKLYGGSWSESSIFIAKIT